jgi:hypothetical protein
MLQAISSWPVAALVLGLAAMLIFREPISTFISRSHEWKAGRFSNFSNRNRSAPSESTLEVVDQNRPGSRFGASDLAQNPNRSLTTFSIPTALVTFGGQRGNGTLRRRGRA